ncbi:RNAdirected DNA polymerase subfamily protein [Acanthamoeba castellanii str. Neff]|uniref:RNAdirected DNA polymerase subfamily protein n=1 Tax=Acanthamoeba castellanii (strain ATCC 30010 / Neff) TaxID=1257118 RepID=L8GLF5_ACACF|nr:RNAdirected DNA polymerase subfamily protein [Acanthamoeba castellanii str. Neff]ELR13538.1 RNAdirected DNA polymerase subfamily protein [Acanthamoeba castellanii str. Neff]
MARENIERDPATAEEEDDDDEDEEDEDSGGRSGGEFSEDVAGQGLSPGRAGVAAAMLAAVREVHGFRRLAKAAVWFPDRSLTTARGQHEYDFLKKIGRKVMAVDRDAPGEVLKLIVELQEDIERRAHIVVVGEEEGWETAGCLEEDEGSFIAGRQDKLAEARKKAESRKKVRKVAPADSLFRSGRAGRSRGGTRYPAPARDDRGVPATGDPPASTAEPRSQRPAGRSVTCYPLRQGVSQEMGSAGCVSLPPLSEPVDGCWGSVCVEETAVVEEQEDNLGDLPALIEDESDSEEEGEDEWWPESESVEVDGEEGLLQGEGPVPLSTRRRREPGWDEHYESDGLGETSPRHLGTPGAGVVPVTDPAELSVVGRLQARAAAWAQIGASDQVRSWIAHGVAFELRAEVSEDRRIFPATPAQQTWLLAEVERLVATGAAELMGIGPSKPAGIRYVSPVFCVPKKGPKKWRLVIDMRRINLGIAERRVRFEGLSSVARVAGRGWWMITFDLAQGYHHLLVEEESCQLLGFRVGDRWFRYRVLPFGLRISPWVFTKVVRAMVRDWRRQGIVVTSYLDDFVVMAPDCEALRRIRDTVITPTLDQLRWLREPTKGEWEPTQCAEVLALVVVRWSHTLRRHRPLSASTFVSLQARGAFAADKLAWPIHHKEMKPVELAVDTLGHYVAGRWVEFESDNVMVVAYLRDGGGPDPWMTDVVRRVWLRAAAEGCGVYNARWIRGSTDNREADWLSRYSDTDDWELSWDTVAELEQQFGGWDSTASPTT